MIKKKKNKKSNRKRWEIKRGQISQYPIKSDWISIEKTMLQRQREKEEVAFKQERGGISLLVKEFWWGGESKWI